jgi:hypothetical protein
MKINKKYEKSEHRYKWRAQWKTKKNGIDFVIGFPRLKAKAVPLHTIKALGEEEV